MITEQDPRPFPLREGPWWVARTLLAAGSVIALLSFGGQIVLAPLLVPLQWGAAKNSHVPGRALFTVLAALLMIEFGWIFGFLITQNEVAGGILGLFVAAAGILWFYRSTNPQ